MSSTQSIFSLCRKGALLINNVFAILAALLMGTSRPVGLYELLIVGRFLTGVNAGNLSEGFNMDNVF